jgi:hypothetical protein
MNSLFDDSLLQSHPNSEPLLAGNDPPAFNHESHNDLFNQNLLPEAHQYNDSYQESYSDNVPDTEYLLNQETNTLADDLFGLSSDSSDNQSISTPLFEHHAHPHYEPIHSWDNTHLDAQKGHQVVLHSETVNHIHSWARTDSTYIGSDGGSYGNSGSSTSISDNDSNKCVDSNLDGVCDSNSGDSGSSSCGSDSSDSSN